MDPITWLYESLDVRLNPETIAGLIRQLPGVTWTAAQQRTLDKAANSPAAGYSSTSDDFHRPTPLAHKTRILAALLGNPADLDDDRQRILAEDPWLLSGQLAVAELTLTGRLDVTELLDRPDPDLARFDFRTRMNREQRAAAGVELSKRRYNRLLRHLKRSQLAAHKMGRQILLRELTMVGVTGLASLITEEQMRADPNAAAFVAYYTAMRKRRRRFTLDSRESPFDEIAQMLLSRCQMRRDTIWPMVAAVYPSPDVLARLSHEQLGVLLGSWMSYLRAGAGMLMELFDRWPTKTVWRARPDLMPPVEARGGHTSPVVDLATMVVQPGVDMSTWNQVATAYNTARDGWINCLAAAGLDLLEVFCPGKAMRLMAADLQFWHRIASGSAADAQTLVWAQLPKPWEVFAGTECPKLLVEGACGWAGVDPAATGWTAPREHTGPVAAFTPTPELVHGVEERDPLWAGLLRRAGVYSGKKHSPDAAALLAERQQSTG